MATRLFHPCQFGFTDDDIRVVQAAISGGTSISGYETVIGTSGGGFWMADFTGGDFGDRTDEGRAETLAWRALNDGMQGGVVPVVVAFCDRWHQPVGDRAYVPHSDDTPFSDDSLYASGGATSRVLAIRNGQAGGNRATILDISLVSERALLAGERFSYIGANGWGERAAGISAVEDIDGGKRVTFSPPIRGGIAVGDALDFDDVRCRMRRTSQPTNALNMGVFSSASISFQEDMRPPVAA